MSTLKIITIAILLTMANPVSASLWSDFFDDAKIIPILEDNFVLSGSGTMNPLPQLKATSSPYSAITSRVSGKDLYMPYSHATTSTMSATTFYGDGSQLTGITVSDFGTDFYTYFSATTTDYLTEGSSNLYSTQTNWDTFWNASTTLTSPTSIPNLAITGSQVSDFGSTFYTYFNATNTDALSEGSTNFYADQDRWDGFWNASTTNSSLVTLSSLSLPYAQIPDFRTGWDSIYNASTTLDSVTTLSNLTTVGTIGAGIWQATDVGVSYGGTGVSDPADHGVLVGSGATALTSLAVGGDGQLLIGSSAQDPVFASLTCDSNLTCTTGAGTLEIDLDADLVILGVATSTMAGQLDVAGALAVGSTFYIDSSGIVQSGTWNGTAIENAYLANSTISGIALGANLAALTATDTTLTFSGSYNGSTARTVGLNLANANTWSALQTFGNATTTLISSTYASSTTGYFGDLYIPDLGTAVGTWLALDANGLLIATSSPSGSGTVTSVDFSVPTGFTIANNPITTSGTLALDFDSGYSLPTDAEQLAWDKKWDLASTTIADGYFVKTGDWTGTLDGYEGSVLRFATTTADYWFTNTAGIDTDGLSEGSTNFWSDQDRWDTFWAATSTLSSVTSIPSLVDVGTITALTATDLTVTNTIAGSIDGQANSAISAGVSTLATITDNPSTSEENPVVFVAGADPDGGNLGLETNSSFTYNPSINKLTFTYASSTAITATNFYGALTGNADTVTGFTPASGSLTLAGADALTITTTGATNSTFPLGTKTLVATDVATLSSLTSIGTLTDLTVTNAITGSVTGNAGTVSTITTLAPDTATTQATQNAITTMTGLTAFGTASIPTTASGILTVSALSATTTLDYWFNNTSGIVGTGIYQITGTLNATTTTTDTITVNTAINLPANSVDFSDDVNATGGRSITLNADAIDADAELYTGMLSFNLATTSPVATSTSILCAKAPVAITITRISGYTDTGTSTIQFDERTEATPNTTGTDVLTSVLDIGSGHTASSAGFANAGIAADSTICLRITGNKNEGASKLNVFIDATKND